MKLNKKGMTLFELLAVIVILGIVAAIAFPTVSGIINNTRLDAVSKNANTFVNTAKSRAVTEFISDGESTTKTYIVYVDNSTKFETPTANNGEKLLNITTDYTNLNFAVVYITINAEGSVTSITNLEYNDGSYQINIPTTVGDIVKTDVNKVTGN